MRDQENLIGDPEMQDSGSSTSAVNEEIPIIPPDASADVVAFHEPKPPATGEDEKAEAERA